MPRIHPALTRWRASRFGRKGRLNAYWQAEVAKDPSLRGLIMTVELVFGADTVVRVATEAVQTTSSVTGEVFGYLPILAEEPEVDHVYKLGVAESAARSLSFSIPCHLVRPDLIIAGGRQVAGIAEVSLQVNGGDYDERIVLMRGSMLGDLGFGPIEGGVIDVVVSDPKASVDMQLPPYLVDTDLWADAEADAVGKRYAIVMNCFDFIPMVWVDNVTPRVGVLYGHGWAVTETGGNAGVQVDGTRVAAASAEYGWAVIEIADGAGHPVTLIQFTGVHAWEFTEEIHLSVTGSSAPGMPVMLVDQIAALIRGWTYLGDGGIAHDLMEEARGRLSGIESRVLINGSGENQARTLEYIERELLASFPMVSMVWDFGGYGAVVTDRFAPAVMSFEPGVFPVLGRDTDYVRESSGDVINHFSIRYDYRLINGSYAGIITRTPENSTLCGVSADNMGEHFGDDIDSRVIKEYRIAGVVADWKVAHQTLATYYIEYRCSAWVLLHLRRGDNVDLTDDLFGIDNVRATVERILYRRGSCLVGLRVWWTYYQSVGGASKGASGVPAAGN